MNPDTSRGEKAPRFARFVATVRERAWLILLVIVVVGGVAFGVSLLLEPRYSAAAQLTYSARDAQLVSQALSPSGEAGMTHNIFSDALTLQTSAFAARVGQAMEGSISAADLRSSVKVTSDPEVDVITIEAISSDPLEVAGIANGFATLFVKERREETEGSLAEAQSLLGKRIESLTAEETASAYGIALKQRRDDLAMLLSMQINDYEVLQEAAVPTSPYFPRPFFNLLLGLGAGLILGVIIAMVLDYFDRRIKDQSTLERVMELPILGTMPLASRKRARKPFTSAVGFADGREVLLESMRMLRSNLKVLGFGDTKTSLLITSTAPGEGKSTLAVNLALAMALSGDRVILVDADLRTPSIHRYLAVPDEQGLGDVLMEKDTSWPKKIQAIDLSPFISPRATLAGNSTSREASVSRFLCLTSGSLPSNPTETLESDAMTDVLAELQGISDYVILDGPPMLVASDSLILAQSVDAVILASTLGKETTAEAIQVRQLLARAEIPALGIVICGGKPQSSARTAISRRRRTQRISET